MPNVVPLRSKSLLRSPDEVVDTLFKIRLLHPDASSEVRSELSIRAQRLYLFWWQSQSRRWRSREDAYVDHAREAERTYFMNLMR